MISAQYTTTTPAFSLLDTPTTGQALPATDPSSLGIRPLAVYIQADTQNIRFTTDGSAPTASVGMLLVAGASPFYYAGPLNGLRFIQVTAGAKLNVTYADVAVQGVPGATGAQGSQGTTGSGTQGTQGFQGGTGTQGSQGGVGTQGTQGVVGSQGTQGGTGAQGTQGTTGAQGVQGFQGTQGSQGAQGSQASDVNPTQTNVTGSRSLNTTFTNAGSRSIGVVVTVRCVCSLAGGNATAQGKSDGATPPTTIASGLVGIQAGLLGEDNTFEVSFVVAPAAKYIVSSAATNGTVTLGSWFEIAF